MHFYVDHEKKWWKEAVVYQVYPRSFMDSNGDGIGDLNGIRLKLDYIKSIGVDVVWLNPIFSSPNDDNGYDISDYRDIMAEFGTMKDFDALLFEMHNRGLKLVIDLVVNHSSDEHFWFKEARKSRDNPYRNYYHWWDAELGKPAKRFSFFDENSDAWQYDVTTNSYYLHYFSRKQPDLNWENPQVRKEVYEIMKFWIAKGVDGFRMDVISFISKDTSFPEIPIMYAGDYSCYYANGPHLHDYLKEMHEEVLSKYDVMTVGECPGVKIDDALNFVDAEYKKLQTFFHFDAVDYGYKKGEFKQPDPQGWALPGFKNIFTKWNDVFEQKGWGSIYLGNHDQPRMVSRWGNDAPEFRIASSKLLLTFLLTMRATPYIYQGDELGMINIKFDNIEDYRDIDTLMMHKQIENNGGDLKYFLEAQKITARDNARTPFQWNATDNAGFTSSAPWIKINADYKTVNAAAQENDPNSILNYFRGMVKLRKSLPELVYGKYDLLDRENENVYTYTRTLDDGQVLVLLNFSIERPTFDIPNTSKNVVNVLMNNLTTLTYNKTMVTLQPWQALVIQL